MSPVQQSIRRVDVDPFFDNTRLDLTKENLGGKKRAVPYHVGNTWRKVSFQVIITLLFTS